jgi:hypothetical protein
LAILAPRCCIESCRGRRLANPPKTSRLAKEVFPKKDVQELSRARAPAWRGFDIKKWQKNKT